MAHFQPSKREECSYKYRSIEKYLQYSIYVETGKFFKMQNISDVFNFLDYDTNGIYHEYLQKLNISTVLK
jgi:hypothetical protein